MTVRTCSHRRLLLQMQSDVINETQQISNDTDCSSSIPNAASSATTTLIYSGLKLHPKPLVPTISMPGVASPLSIVKKLSIPDGTHLETPSTAIRNSSSTSNLNSTQSTTPSTPSSIRLVTPTTKSSSPTSLQFQIADKSSISAAKTTTATNGSFPTSKTYIFNPTQTSTTTVNKQSIISNSTSPSSSVLNLISPGTTSPKIQTLNSLTIASNNDLSGVNDIHAKAASISNPNQSLFLSKNRVTLVQPLITTPSSSSTNHVNNNTKTTTNAVTQKLVIQQNAGASGANTNFWPQSSSTQAAKIYSIPPSSILPTAKVLSRPVQLIPTPISSSEHHSHHPQITHVQTIKTDKHDTINSYPLSMHFGLSSPSVNENPLSALNMSHGHTFPGKTFDSSGHQAYIHMQLLPSTSSNETTTCSQPVQFTLPTTHLYPSPSSVLISTTTRSMDHNNNHQTNTTITTPIVCEMQIDEKANESSSIKNIHATKTSHKNRTRLPLQPSTPQISSTLHGTSISTTNSTSSSSISSPLTSSSSPSSITTVSSSTATTIRQPKKHKLNEDEQTSTNEPPTKIAHYEQLDSSFSTKSMSKVRHRPLSKFSIENTTLMTSSPIVSTISIGVETNGLAKKRTSTETANMAILEKKRKLMAKVTQDTVSNENLEHNTVTDRIDDPSSESNIEKIDDELLGRLSQDFVYLDQRTGIRWIGTKTRPKSMSTLVSRFSWKPKINHYEKYADISRTNPKRTVPVKSFDELQKKLTQPWSSWRIDRLTSYITDLTQDEQTTQNNLSDILPLLKIDDESVRATVEDLIQANIQRHRCFCEQLNQISSLLINLFDHGNTLKEICSTSKTNPPTKQRTKER